MAQAYVTEAEAQALIALIELAQPITTENNNSYHFFPATLEDARTYFRGLALDLGPAFVDLAGRGLVAREGEAWALTPEGLALAGALRAARPPIWYWYREFYAAIEHSAAFGQYCAQVFGRDMGQHGFSDLGELEQALALGPAGADRSWLDVGCGNGKIAEYVAERTGARVLGIDNVPEAISAALRRTASQGDRLRYQVGHLDTLDLAGETFDAILSIDSIFFGRSLEGTLARLRNMLKPGGYMLILCGEDLAAPLANVGLAYTRSDLSASHRAHLQRKRRVIEPLRAAFEAEGHLFIWENLMQESDAADTPRPRWLYRAPV